MIARMWHGRILRKDAEAYHRYIERTGLREYRATPGNLGAHYLQRHEGEITHVVTLTFWESVDAIRRFAGDDYESAKYYPEDARFLLEREPRVLHYEVVPDSGMSEGVRER
jgi:heme-degrading monooxygenase HmoA